MAHPCVSKALAAGCLLFIKGARRPRGGVLSPAFKMFWGAVCGSLTIGDGGGDVTDVSRASSAGVCTVGWIIGSPSCRVAETGGVNV